MTIRQRPGRGQRSISTAICSLTSDKNLQVSKTFLSWKGQHLNCGSNPGFAGERKEKSTCLGNTAGVQISTSWHSISWSPELWLKEARIWEEWYPFRVSLRLCSVFFCSTGNKKIYWPWLVYRLAEKLVWTADFCTFQIIIKNNYELLTFLGKRLLGRAWAYIVTNRANIKGQHIGQLLWAQCWFLRPPLSGGGRIALKVHNEAYWYMGQGAKEHPPIPSLAELKCL